MKKTLILITTSLILIGVFALLFYTTTVLAETCTDMPGVGEVCWEDDWQDTGEVTIDGVVVDVDEDGNLVDEVSGNGDVDDCEIDDSCEEECEEFDDSGDSTSQWIEYDCQDNSCGGAILAREASQYCWWWSVGDSCVGETDGGSGCNPVEYSNPIPFSNCGDYQVCNGSGWSKVIPACECAGKCYTSPNLKALDDDELFPQNVFDDFDDLKLPVNIWWEDNVETEIAVDSCTVNSYHYQFIGGGETVDGVESEELQDVVRDCQLIPDTTYAWRVQACLDAGGEDCGDWSEYENFKSSTAPELHSPYDEDFEGEESGTTLFPAVLEWCSDPGANSYSLNAYEVLSLDPLVKQQVIQSGTSGSTKYYDSSLKGGLNQLRKGATYVWEVAGCQDRDLNNCGLFSQLWSLIPGGELSPPLLLEPPLRAFINMEDVLQWRNVVFATHFLIDIKELSSSLFVQNPEYSFRSFWNKLSLNTQYTWRVASCGGSPTSRNIEDCRREDGTIPWSKERIFTTTGAAPTNLNATPTESGRTAIPFTLNWSGKGAASYIYEVLNNGSIVTRGKTESSNVLIKYEDVPQGMFNRNTTYSWRVRTCANKEGTVCGGWATSSLTTANLATPTINLPQTNIAETLRTIHMGWSKVFSGNFYEHELTYVSLSSPLLENPETSSYCVGDVGNTVNGIKSTVTVNKDLRCTGEYRLRVRTCIDIKCDLAGEWSNSTSFTVKEAQVPRGVYGLVPCGLGINNPNTPWDERESCGFGHIVLLLRNLIDFAIWKLSLVIIVLMAIATGATIFFSIGGTNLLTQIKSTWRAVGVGVLILLFAWILLNLLLGILGFNVGIFGNWYEIPL